MAEEEGWSDGGSHASNDSDPWLTDVNGISFEFNKGFYLEPEPKTPWAFLASTFRLDASQRYANKRNPRGDYGFCAALLIRPELMPDRQRRLQWLASPFFATEEVREDRIETTRHAFSKLFDLRTGLMKDQFRGKGLWGADDVDSPWVLVVERFTVHPVLRGQGWGTKLAVRMLEEITSKARKAGKTVIVLTMPSSPEGEMMDNTRGLSAAAKQKWREESKRKAMAFWRSLGSIRVGETLFFGWTRGLGPHVVTKTAVRSEDLDKDAEIDRQKGYWNLLKGSRPDNTLSHNPE